jgi:hypothetical protein
MATSPRLIKKRRIRKRAIKKVKQGRSVYAARQAFYEADKVASRAVTFLGKVSELARTSRHPGVRQLHRMAVTIEQTAEKAMALAEDIMVEEDANA